MDRKRALRIVESLRMGIPPEGEVRALTVGRADEVATLGDRLGDGVEGALLVEANYGSGKSHLLRYVREEALDQGYAVASVTIDSASGVRFNRMDQILGAVWRGLEVPDCDVSGPASLLDLVAEVVDLESKAPGPNHTFWVGFSDASRWRTSGSLASPATWVGMRAWCRGSDSVKPVVADWFQFPENYRSQRKPLYEQLVEKQLARFRDPRSLAHFCSQDLLAFHSGGYAQSWAAIGDIHKVAVACGLGGLVILFDEFEDVITNLRNIAYQETAFHNLFAFFFDPPFGGQSYFAVTPEFSGKCKRLLLEKDRWFFDHERFDELTRFAMSPLRESDVEELAFRIADIHGSAYQWKPMECVDEDEFRDIVDDVMRVPVQDRVRRAIKAAVELLDDCLEDD